MDKSDSAKKLAGIGIGIGLAAVCPPAAAIMGIFSFLRGARKYAQSGKIEDATEMIMGYSDSVSINQK